jgi:hypothetical protein
VVRPDSGTLELDFALPQTFGALDAGDLDRIGDFGSMVASKLDHRLLHRVDDQWAVRSPGSAVVYESQSRIDEGGQEIDIIGPGGRFTVYRFGQRMSADFTIRKRQRNGIPTSWLDFTGIAERVRAELREAGEGVRLQAAFGYVEASKYEFQKWLTLAFAFTIERPIKAENNPRWSVRGRIAYGRRFLLRRLQRS